MCDRFESDENADPSITEKCKEEAESFCNSCCHYHIGTVYQSKMMECNEKCTKIMAMPPADDS